MRRLAHSHSLGGGLVLGLVVAQRPLWIFAAGVAAGVALVFAVRALRRVGGLASRAASRFLPPGDGAKRTASAGALAEGTGVRDELSPAASWHADRVLYPLTPAERERARLEGLRQGHAAGIRAAARLEVRDGARREAMAAALEDHWQGVRSGQVAHALDVTDPRD